MERSTGPFALNDFFLCVCVGGGKGGMAFFKYFTNSIGGISSKIFENCSLLTSVMSGLANEPNF